MAANETLKQLTEQTEKMAEMLESTSLVEQNPTARCMYTLANLLVSSYKFTPSYAERIVAKMDISISSKMSDPEDFDNIDRIAAAYAQMIQHMYTEFTKMFNDPDTVIEHYASKMNIRALE